MALAPAGRVPAGVNPFWANASNFFRIEEQPQDSKSMIVLKSIGSIFSRCLKLVYYVEEKSFYERKLFSDLYKYRARGANFDKMMEDGQRLDANLKFKANLKKSIMVVVAVVATLVVTTLLSPLLVIAAIGCLIDPSAVTSAVTSSLELNMAKSFEANVARAATTTPIIVERARPESLEEVPGELERVWPPEPREEAPIQRREEDRLRGEMLRGALIPYAQAREAAANRSNTMKKVALAAGVLTALALVGMSVLMPEAVEGAKALAATVAAADIPALPTTAKNLLSCIAGRMADLVAPKVA